MSLYEHVGEMEFNFISTYGRRIGKAMTVPVLLTLFLNGIAGFVVFYMLHGAGQVVTDEAEGFLSIHKELAPEVYESLMREILIAYIVFDWLLILICGAALIGGMVGVIRILITEPIYRPDNTPDNLGWLFLIDIFLLVILVFEATWTNLPLDKIYLNGPWEIKSSADKLAVHLHDAWGPVGARDPHFEVSLSDVTGLRIRQVRTSFAVKTPRTQVVVISGEEERAFDMGIKNNDLLPHLMKVCSSLAEAKAISFAEEDRTEE